MDHYGPKGFRNGPKLNHFPTKKIILFQKVNVSSFQIFK